MLIREAVFSDLADLQKLYLQLHDTELLPESPALLSLWQAILADVNYHVLVCEETECIVGSVTLVVIKNLTRRAHPYALIENVVTDKAYRRLGYASRLMERAVTLAEACGCYKVFLQTSAKDEHTLHFYEACGFSRTEKTAFIRRLKTDD